VLTANTSFYKHFHVSPEQTEKRLVYDLGNGQWNIPQLRTFLEDVLPQNRIFKDFEMTQEFERIGRRTLLLSGRKVDQLQKILLSVDDITERVKFQAALGVSERRFRRLFEAAKDGILVVDPVTRKITDANPFITDLLGYKLEELVGRELWEIGLLKDEAASQAAFRELQAKGYIRYDTLPLESRAGRKREVEFVSNLYEENGHKVIQCNVRDITERKQIEQALKAANNQISHHASHLEETVVERTGQLQDTIGELEAFSYSISHDMRAPLRAMQGFANILLKEHSEQLNREGVNFLQKINAAAGRMDALIQDVLTYTRILRGELTMEVIDLDPLIRQIVETYPQLHAGNADLQIEGVLPKVLGNMASLTQCISNLLINAVKFVKPQERPQVRVRAETVGADVRVWVEDNGIGISPENQERVFKMFERVHHSRDYEGTGIGLAIVRKAVDRMGGKVGVESAIGKGSKFWIQLRREGPGE
jgi:PAS domain S-box-containing protein